MSTASLFINEHKPLIKRTFSVNEEDYEHVSRVFTETGFLQYFPGLCFKLLSQSLKTKGINDLSDRLTNPSAATIAGFVSDFNTAFKACCAHERPRVGGVCEGASLDGGKSADA